VDRGFALFVFPLIPFPKLQNSCSALSFPGGRGWGKGSSERLNAERLNVGPRAVFVQLLVSSCL
jgi:hypothetical protein